MTHRIGCGNNTGFGGIAQLGERLHGMQEVSGSIPLISTKIVKNRFDLRVNCSKIQFLSEQSKFSSKFLGPHRLEA